MRIVIVGAGVGGLTAALSLYDAGFEDLAVVEAVPELRPLGVGINLLPHSVRELTELGLADAVAACGVATGELAYHDLYGSRIWAEPRGLAAGYKWPQYSVHRGHLQMALYAAALDRLPAGTVRTGLRLTGFAEADGVVTATFADADGGTVTETADLLIGADGIHSAVRAQLNPAEGAPVWNGMVMWRGTTYADPYLTGRSMIMAGDGARKFVCYPLSDPDPETGKVLTNWVAEVPDPERPVLEKGNWNRPADRDEILRHFGPVAGRRDWDFDWLDLRTLIEDAVAVYEYPMVDRDPLPSWTSGRATLLGDAAHAMHPIGSNGASQAVLDARVLARALGTAATVEEALAGYEAARRPATTALQESNRQMGPEIVMRIAHQRAPEGFARIDDVMSAEELTEIADSYKRTAGFHPGLLNERESYSVTARGPLAGGGRAG